MMFRVSKCFHNDDNSREFEIYSKLFLVLLYQFPWFVRYLPFFQIFLVWLDFAQTKTMDLHRNEQPRSPPATLAERQATRRVAYLPCLLPSILGTSVARRLRRPDNGLGRGHTGSVVILGSRSNDILWFVFRVLHFPCCVSGDDLCHGALIWISFINETFIFA